VGDKIMQKLDSPII